MIRYAREAGVNVIWQSANVWQRAPAAAVEAGTAPGPKKQGMRALYAGCVAAPKQLTPEQPVCE